MEDNALFGFYQRQSSLVSTLKIKSFIFWEHLISLSYFVCSGAFVGTRPTSKPNLKTIFVQIEINNSFAFRTNTHPCVRCTISLIAIITYTITNTLTLTITTYLAQATNSNTPNHLLTDQCDQIKIAKCLYKLPKNEFTRKINDFDTFTKIA